MCDVLCAYAGVCVYAHIHVGQIMEKHTRAALPAMRGTAVRLPACLCGVLTSLIFSSCTGWKIPAASCGKEPRRIRGGSSAAASAPCQCEYG